MTTIAEVAARVRVPGAGSEAVLSAVAFAVAGAVGDAAEREDGATMILEEAVAIRDGVGEGGVVIGTEVSSIVSRFFLSAVSVHHSVIVFVLFRIPPSDLEKTPRFPLHIVYLMFIV